MTTEMSHHGGLHPHSHQQMEMSGVRVIGRNQLNHSGNVVYKVPNINVNTAIRSSKRIGRPRANMGQYEEDFESYRWRRE
jgi:hypothetical protein